MRHVATGCFCAIVMAILAAPVRADDVGKEDIIILSKAEVSDQLIIAFLKSKKAKLDLSAEDVGNLVEAGVSTAVIEHILNTADHPTSHGNKNDDDHSHSKDGPKVKQPVVKRSPSTVQQPAVKPTAPPASPPVIPRTRTVYRYRTVYPTYPYYDPYIHHVYDHHFFGHYDYGHHGGLHIGFGFGGHHGGHH